QTAAPPDAYYEREAPGTSGGAWNADSAPPPAPPAASTPVPADLAGDGYTFEEAEEKASAPEQERAIREERDGTRARRGRETAFDSRAPQAPPPPPTPAPVQAPRPASPQAQSKPDGRASGQRRGAPGRGPAGAAEGGEGNGVFGFDDEVDEAAPAAESPMPPMEPEPQVGVTDDEAPPPGGRQGRFDGGDEIEGVEFGARNRPVDPSLDPAQAETGKT